MKLKVAYARVSSREQSENTNALEQQKARLLKESPDKIFVDVESGASTTRANYNRMLDLIKEEKVDAVIATRWDRLTRSAESYQMLKTVLRKFGVRLILLDQGEADFDSATGELTADITALLAMFERSMLRERVQKGQEFRRARKAACARAPWGYLTDNEAYILDERPVICSLEDRPNNYHELADLPDYSPQLVSFSRSDVAREAIDLFFEMRRPPRVLKRLYEKYGTQIKKGSNLVLCDEFRLWSLGSSIIEWIQNPVLRGHTSYLKTKNGRGAKKSPSEWEHHRDTHPEQRLLSDLEFREIQDILRTNSKRPCGCNVTSYLVGLVYCDRCGYKCVLKSNGDYKYYGCRHSTTHCQNRKCVRIELINEAIITEIFGLALALSTENTPRSFSSLLETDKTQRIRDQLKSLSEMLEVTSNPAVKQAKFALEQELEDQLSIDKQGSRIAATARQVLCHPQIRNLAFWHTLSEKERELMFSKLVSRLSIDDGQVRAVELKQHYSEQLGSKTHE